VNSYAPITQECTGGLIDTCTNFTGYETLTSSGSVSSDGLTCTVTTNKVRSVTATVYYG
jgi:hypothetical protein